MFNHVRWSKTSIVNKFSNNYKIIHMASHLAAGFTSLVRDELLLEKEI